MENEIRGGDAVVVGGGVIGCSIARALAQEGVSTVLVERDEPGRGATWAAAGMLAPLGEAGEPGPFLELGMESMRLYPNFVDDLQGETALDVGYAASGKLHVAFDESELPALRARLRWAQAWDSSVAWVESEEIHRLDPTLSHDALAALLIPSDHQVDNRKLGAALEQAARGVGVHFHTGSAVRAIEQEGGRTSGVVLESGKRIRGERVILAAGCWSGRVGGLPRPLPIRPVRGQMLALEPRLPPPPRIVATSQVYLVPRGDGRLLVGATLEEVGFEGDTSAAGIAALLGAAVRAAPSLGSARIGEMWAGLRPGTPDDLPILGEDSELPGLFHASGHYRNGILLAPVTAAIIRALVLGQDPPIDAKLFHPDRFRATIGA